MAVTALAALLEVPSSIPCTYMLTPVPRAITLLLSSGIRHTFIQKTHKILENCKGKEKVWSCSSEQPKAPSITHLSFRVLGGYVEAIITLSHISGLLSVFIIGCKVPTVEKKDHFLFPEFEGRYASGILKSKLYFPIVFKS